MLIAEECPKWVVAFIENRLYVNYRHRDIKRFIEENRNLKDNEKLTYSENMKSSADLDITALYTILMRGDILKYDEKKSEGSQRNTVADLVDRLRLKRNTFIHTTNASIEQKEYKEQLADFKFFAEHFDKINKTTQNEYQKAVDLVDSKNFTNVDLDKNVERYKEYVKVIVQREILTEPKGKWGFFHPDLYDRW